jgi:hypothetical protein
MSFHRQVVLPELGFSVDEGLEELVRLCWHRGIATCSSCIGTGGAFHGPNTVICFGTLSHAWRWTAVTGRAVDEPEYEHDLAHPEEESTYTYGADFPPSDIPDIVTALRWQPPDVVRLVEDPDAPVTREDLEAASRELKVSYPLDELLRQVRFLAEDGYSRWTYHRAMGCRPSSCGCWSTTSAWS